MLVKTYGSAVHGIDATTITIDNIDSFIVVHCIRKQNE